MIFGDLDLFAFNGCCYSVNFAPLPYLCTDAGYLTASAIAFLVYLQEVAGIPMLLNPNLYEKKDLVEILKSCFSIQKSVPNCCMTQHGPFFYRKKKLYVGLLVKCASIAATRCSVFAAYFIG